MTWTPTRIGMWVDDVTNKTVSITFTITAALVPLYCRKCGWIWGLPNYKYCPYCGEELEEDC